VYKKVLPFSDDMKVKDQFGWLPLSVVEPDKASKIKWKNAYLDDGMKEKRRSDDTKYLPGLGFSEFHAGMTENILMYWSMDNSVVVDPFSGRLTRAFISSKMGRKYYGYDISPTTVKRVKAHLEQHDSDATIYCDDGCKMKQTPDDFADLVMTCPPYHQLEKYESVDGQLSDIKKYSEFLDMIELCGTNINRVLKPGGFCVWVCGDWRESGKFRNFHSDTIRLFEKAGLITHDIMIMKNISPFAALQAGKVASKRYTSKVHEYVLVFRKEGELEINTDVIVKREEKDNFW
jgi:DNA modification methylase